MNRYRFLIVVGILVAAVLVAVGVAGIMSSTSATPSAISSQPLVDAVGNPISQEMLKGFSVPEAIQKRDFESCKTLRAKYPHARECSMSWSSSTGGTVLVLDGSVTEDQLPQGGIRTYLYKRGSQELIRWQREIYVPAGWYLYAIEIATNPLDRQKQEDFPK